MLTAHQAAAMLSAENWRAALELLDLMRETSFEYGLAGWSAGLEYRLWDLMQAAVSGRRPRKHEPSKNELDELRRLHAKAGGWFFWDEENEETFIPTAAWMERVAARQRQP